MARSATEKKKGGGSATAILAVLAVALSGCARATVRLPVSAEQRSALGRVRIVVVDAPPALSVSAPTPLGAVGGAAVGATKGLALGVLGGAGRYATLGGFVEGCVLAAAMPYLVANGGYHGAANAVPASSRSASFREITGALHDTDERRLERAIERERAGRPGEASGIAARDDDVDTLAEVTLVRLALEEAPACSAMRCVETPKPKPFDVVPSVDPPLVVAVEARLRLLERRAGNTLFETSYLHRSDEQEKFTVWGDDGGARLRASRDDLLETLGRCIALDVFGPAISSPSRDYSKTTCKDER